MIPLNQNAIVAEATSDVKTAAKVFVGFQRDLPKSEYRHC